MHAACILKLLDHHVELIHSISTLHVIMPIFAEKRPGVVEKGVFLGAAYYASPVDVVSGRLLVRLVGFFRRTADEPFSGGSLQGSQALGGGGGPETFGAEPRAAEQQGEVWGDTEALVGVGPFVPNMGLRWYKSCSSFGTNWRVQVDHLQTLVFSSRARMP